jgi:hypothetical protein
VRAATPSRPRLASGPIRRRIVGPERLIPATLLRKFPPQGKSNVGFPTKPRTRPDFTSYLDARLGSACWRVAFVPLQQFFKAGLAAAAYKPPSMWSALLSGLGSIGVAAGARGGPFAGYNYPTDFVPDLAGDDVSLSDAAKEGVNSGLKFNAWTGNVW